ncbi:DMT family transporter [Neoaquamicrobium sediminum]|uniref:DMT family transporter n=1 Tax=Neoaquamicrobium sediminum TaxID=1849104 RepID=UPI0015658197|nr:EamA family transporter [Mesorhizobium sediminum]NRC54739.1 EamA family transporter [Mesorhizobium sediminum]
MSAPISDHSKGLLLTAIGGLTLTVDIPLIKLANGDVWSVLMVRCATTLAVTAIVWAVWRALSPRAPALLPGKAGLAVAACYGIGSICFLSAVYHIPTANLVFLLAFNTVFAAVLSWLFLKERPRPATLAAMAAMLVGVAIIVSDGISAGSLFGNVLAMCSSLCIASAITITRATGQDMGFTSLVAVSLPLLVAVAMVAQVGYRIEAPGWIVLNGAVVMPIAFFLLATGPKYISGPEVAMFYLLETVLAPIWVWLIFLETPTPQTLIGGAILITALLSHSLWQLHQGRRRRAAQAVRHAP